VAELFYQLPVKSLTERQDKLKINSEITLVVPVCIAICDLISLKRQINSVIKTPIQ
jgi:hypothetical protein